MKKKLSIRVCISLLLLMISSLAYGQQFKDRIITRDMDTIECNIIEIADQKVHFTFLNYSKIQTSNLPLSEIKAFQLGDEDVTTGVSQPQETTEEPVISPFAKTTPPAPAPTAQTAKETVQVQNNQSFNRAIQDAGASLMDFQRQYYNGMLTSFLGGTLGTLTGIILATISPELGLAVMLTGVVVSLVGSIQMLTSYRHIGEAGEYLLYGTQTPGARPGS